MAKAYWIVGLLVLLFGNSFGQQTTGKKNQYIVVYPNKLLLSPYLETKSHLMQVEMVNLNGPTKLNYLSNFVLTGGLRFRYKWLNFQVGTRLPVTRLNEQLGNTKNFALGVSVVKRNYTLQTKYETYTGFYLQNTDEWLPSYRANHVDGAYYLRPDIKAQTLFTVYNYILNHKRFSNPAAVFQFERQRKAAFGIALGASHMYNRLEADSNLFPRNTNTENLPITGTFLASHTLGLQLGLMGTIPLFSKRHWFVSASIIPGYSLQYGRTTKSINSIIPNRIFYGITNELRFGIGYNAQKWFAAFQITSFGNSIKVRETETYLVQNAYFRISTGVRFGK
jgi:hypothetical protein